MENLQRLSWRARGTGATCIAEVNRPIRGYQPTRRIQSYPFAVSAPDGSNPTVGWINFDGETYWVGLLAAQGWPRTIRVTQRDVDAVKWSSSQADDID